MKKILSLMTAGILTAALSITAFADGRIVSPTANENNSVTFENSAGKSLAKVFFQADSDPQDFYLNLSTAWLDAGLGYPVSDQDAYLFAFTVKPASIPSNTVPTIYLYNPFDEDVDFSDVHLYTESGGKLTEITANAVAGEDAGESVFAVKTRTPGVFILSDGPLDTNAVVPTASAEEKKAVSTTGAAAKKVQGKTGLILPSKA